MPVALLDRALRQVLDTSTGLLPLHNLKQYLHLQLGALESLRIQGLPD
jgi:hypothetical protein